MGQPLNSAKMHSCVGHGSDEQWQEIHIWKFKPKETTVHLLEMWPWEIYFSLCAPVSLSKEALSLFHTYNLI